MRIILPRFGISATRLNWFVGLWLASVSLLGMVAMVIRAVLHQ